MDNGAASASFSYSGPMTESVLLGTMSTRFSKQELFGMHKKWRSLTSRMRTSLCVRPTAIVMKLKVCN
jgi:hypothetical protein